MNLVVGKNSTLVKSIASELENCTFISHKELRNIDGNSYDKIFIFSWSRNSIEENLELLKFFEPEKVIFISSSAVFSLNKRKQWNNYPNWKLIMENEVLSKGGSVLRLGVCDVNHKRGIFGYYPCTKQKMLIEIMNNSISDNEINCFKIEHGKLCSSLTLLSKFINFLAGTLPSSFIFQAPFEFFLKTLGIKSYGYTHDANYFFSQESLIGHGCLGSVYAKKYKPDKIFVSNRNDIRISEEGFVDTIQGFKKNGLAKYWHGVYVIKKNGGFIKKVPIIVDRARSLKNLNSFHVNQISFKENFIMVTGTTKPNKEVTFFTNSIVLAAGALENVRLLKKFIHETIFLDDHEWLSVGTISFEEAKNHNLLKSKSFLIFPKFLKEVNSDINYLIDVRPYNPKKITKNFYADTSINLFIKIIKKFSFYDLNEAFFNKFGIGFKTKNVSVFLQMLSKDCIETDGEYFHRTRISQKNIEGIKNNLSMKFKTFNASSNDSFDGQHIFGGRKIFQNNEINRLIKSGRLKICGSPTSELLDVFYHTNKLKNKIKSK